MVVTLKIIPLNVEQCYKFQLTYSEKIFQCFNHNFNDEWCDSDGLISVVTYVSAKWASSVFGHMIDRETLNISSKFN